VPANAAIAVRITHTIHLYSCTARYFYLQRHAFGGKVEGRTYGTSTTGGGPLHLSDLEERILEVHWRMKRVNIENLDACACITKYDRAHTFFYIDPPYYETAGYADPFCHGDYERLRSTLDGIKGKFLLSLNDHPQVREIFALNPEIWATSLSGICVL